MKYLLDPPAIDALRQFVRGPTLIALDYDGTLAPIVARPEDARMRDGTRSLFGSVARRYPVVVLTGRARRDALRLLSGIPLLEVVGSHGAETSATAGSRFLRRVEAWRAQLTEHLKTLAGIRIEDKRYSLAVHYRQAGDPESARRRIGVAAGALRGARIVGGKQVVNIVPEDAPDKGQALLAACARLGCERAVYIGDDDTDESVFVMEQAERIFTIRVGKNPESRSAYYVGSQEEIDAVLQALLDARAF